MFIENNAKSDVLGSRQASKYGNNGGLFQMFSHICGTNHHNDSSLHVDWGHFCHNLRGEDTLLSNWGRLATRIVLLQSKPHIIVPEVTSKFQFKHSFRLSLALTLRALRIKGVSPDIVSRTSQTLCSTAVAVG